MYVLLFILFFSFNSLALSSLGVFKQGESLQLIKVCDTCTFMNLDSIYFPNGSINTFNSSMTKVFHTYNFSFSDTSQLGDYTYFVCGNKSGLVCEDVSFEVTIDGLGDDSFNGWLPIVFVFAFASALSLFGSFSIRSSGLQGLRALLFLFGVVNALLLWVLPFLISVNPSRVSSFNPVGLGMVGIALGLIFTVILFYELFLFDRATRDKKRKEDE